MISNISFLLLVALLSLASAKERGFSDCNWDDWESWEDDPKCPITSEDFKIIFWISIGVFVILLICIVGCITCCCICCACCPFHRSRGKLNQRIFIVTEPREGHSIPSQAPPQIKIETNDDGEKSGSMKYENEKRTEKRGFRFGWKYSQNESQTNVAAAPVQLPEPPIPAEPEAAPVVNGSSHENYRLLNPTVTGLNNVVSEYPSLIDLRKDNADISSPPYGPTLATNNEETPPSGLYPSLTTPHVHT